MSKIFICFDGGHSHLCDTSIEDAYNGFVDDFGIRSLDELRFIIGEEVDVTMKLSINDKKGNRKK